MTRQQAIDTGQNAAVRFGKPFIVYRFVAWPVDCYGVIACDRGLPREAETFETLRHDRSVELPSHAQGSLF